MVYAFLIERMDEDQQAALEALLAEPFTVDTWGEGADAEAGQDAFLAIMGGT